MNEPKLAMGFIETVGLVTAIAAGDAALKSANVTLIGRENSRGDGMITLKIAGNVGAVEAALSAARAEGNKVGKIASIKMIARPASGFGSVMGFNEDTVAVSSWLDSVAPGVTPGRIKRVEGCPLKGNMDLWEAEKSLREAEKTEKKPVREKSQVSAKETIAADKDEKDEKNIETALEASAGTAKKNTSRRRKKPKRQPAVKKIDIKAVEPEIKEIKTEVKEDSSENSSNKPLTEKN